MPGSDAVWMRHALRSAVRSLGRTAPNPGVGCVVVRDGRVIGAGRHAACGGPHAERAALDDCRRRGHDPQGATVYVTLAPCTTHGRTPPCAEALAAARVARVVAGCADPSQPDPGPILAGGGVAYTCGCLEHLARMLHGGFLRRVASGRPRVTGKWAMSVDGMIACASGDAAWISGPRARALSRRRRRAFDAILVGAGTALADDPSLRASATERDPVRIVLSPALSVAERAGDLRLWREGDPPWVVHDADAPAAATDRLDALGSRRLPLDLAADPARVAAALGEAGINELLVEGGATVHGAWLRAGVYDRLECYVGDRSLGGGLPVVTGNGAAAMSEAGSWRLEATPAVLDGSVWLRYRRAEADGTP